jgi:hypothetical protein
MALSYITVITMTVHTGSGLYKLVSQAVLYEVKRALTVPTFLSYDLQILCLADSGYGK